MLSTVTPAEIVSVTRNDSSAAFEVTASRNACQPPPTDCHAIAANGSSTITESHTTETPTRNDVPLPRNRLRFGALSPRVRPVTSCADRRRHPVACV